MQETKTLLTDEKHANAQLLEITGGIVTGVTDHDKLIGSLVLPGSITEIGMFAFLNCSGLTSIVIPNSVTQIGPFAFSTCRNLKTVIIESTVIKQIDETAFENVHADIHFTVKTDAVKAMLKENSTIRDEQITVKPNL